ncbi:MAG: hypothetical protein MJY52_04940, partial [Bacteroidaceae bacterium]|nr:hypothetical protein [Bacteroidaceae bacterium]
SLCVAINNVGTKTPFERGIYVAWGELTGHQNKDGSYNPDLYNWTNYKWCKNGNGKALTKYCFNESYWDSGSGKMDMKTKLDDEDDLARQAWGEPWRMMTYEEAYCLAPNSGVDPNRNGLGRVRWVEGNTVDGHIYVTKWNRIAPDGTVDEDRFVWLPPTQLSDITGTEYSYYWTKTIQSGLHGRTANPSYAMQIASASTTAQHWNSGVMQNLKVARA